MPGSQEYGNFDADLAVAGVVEYPTPADIRQTIKYMCQAIGNPGGSSGPTLTTPTLGAAAVVSTATRVICLINITTSGTAFSIKIGPTNAVATTVVASAATTAGMLYTVPVPAGWYIAVAGTTAAWSTVAMPG